MFRAGDLELTGKDELTAWRGERDAGEAGDNGQRHWNSSYRITPSPEGAEGRVYWLPIDVSSGSAATSSVWLLRRRLREDVGRGGGSRGASFTPTQGKDCQANDTGVSIGRPPQGSSRLNASMHVVMDDPLALLFIRCADPESVRDPTRMR